MNRMIEIDESQIYSGVILNIPFFPRKINPINKEKINPIRKGLYNRDNFLLVVMILPSLSIKNDKIKTIANVYKWIRSYWFPSKRSAKKLRFVTKVATNDKI